MKIPKYKKFKRVPIERVEPVKNKKTKKSKSKNAAQFIEKFLELKHHLKMLGGPGEISEIVLNDYDFKRIHYEMTKYLQYDSTSLDRIIDNDKFNLMGTVFRPHTANRTSK